MGISGFFFKGKDIWRIRAILKSG